VGNEILADRFLLVDIASIALGELEPAPLLFARASPVSTGSISISNGCGDA
jgi:hypothetical protein